MTDPFSDVLRSVRLSGGIFLDARLTAPWSVVAHITPDDCKVFLPSPVQIVGYHFVIEGMMVLGVEGEAPIEVHAGEIVLLPRNDIHTLASAPGLPAVSAASLIQPSSTEGGLARISYGGGGAQTHIVCGFLGTEDARNPLLATLPRKLKLDVRQGTSRDWIEASFRFAASELVQGRLASSEVMSRLSELLLVEAVRHYSATLPDEHAGWLKGLKDPQVGRVLALIHQDIAATWSVDDLAREVGMSRSAFADRFGALLGMPPIRYLTILRLQAAKMQLRELGRTVGQVAHAVGYESEEAFGRAFKREYGVSPARWRDHGSAA